MKIQVLLKFSEIKESQVLVIKHLACINIIALLAPVLFSVWTLDSPFFGSI